MNVNTAHAKPAGDGARVLAAGASEASQDVGGDVKALHLGQCTDGPAHGFVGDLTPDAQQ